MPGCFTYKATGGGGVLENNIKFISIGFNKIRDLQYPVLL